VSAGAHRLLTALALWFAATALAQQPAAPLACPPQATAPTPEQLRADMRDARDRGFLWRITRGGRTSYLYGTLHIARRHWLAPGPQLARALAASDLLALELDMLDVDIQRRLAAAMMARDTDDPLPSATAARLRAQFDAACLPAMAMQAIVPEVQLAALTTLAARWDGLDPAYAIDSFLAAHARSLGKAVVSLETPELQVALLEGEPSERAEALDSGLRQLERGEARPMLVRIAAVWDEGRADELARYEQWCGCADTRADRAQLRRLLDDRNPALAERIDAFHAAGHSVLAAVGALHMVGPLGLPALMAARGFEVQRVEFGR
jgi:uncharacterized protein